MVSASPAAVIRLARKYFSSSEPPVASSIATFLAKPINISSGNFNTTDLSGTFPQIYVPAQLIQKSVWRDKLSGYFGFRATMCFRLQVNGNRFQQGRYMLTFCPTGGASSGALTPGQAWVDLHSNTLKQRSQLPRVEIDINCDTEATLRVPFNSAFDFYRVQELYDSNWYHNLGVLRIYPYVPLTVAATGSNTCSYTLWAHLEDVELIGNDVPITPQMANFTSSTKKSRKNNASEQEANSALVGPLQSMAMKVSKASGYLAPVPMLGSFATPVSWAADIAANVASVFGWSSPANMEALRRVGRNTMMYSNNVDKIDQSLPLALSVKNAVTVLPGFSGTNIDELDIAHIASIPAWHNTYSWSDSVVAGTQLFAISLSPQTFKSTRTYLTQTATDLTPLAYIGNKFAYWRGGITLTIKFVKTEFHSGRLAVVYVPTDWKTTTTNSVNYDNSSYLQRDIIDIRLQNEVTFTIPYFSPQPYLPATTSMGTLRVYIVDQLVAPASVPTTISLITEVSGAPDMEFSVYAASYGIPALGITAQSAAIFPDKSTCSLASKTVGTMKEGQFQLDTSQAAIGERVLSLRSLLKKFVAFQFKPTGIKFGKTVNCIPFGSQYSNISPSTNAFPNNGNDLYGELASIFMYSRGGVRLKYIVTRQVRTMTDISWPMYGTSMNTSFNGTVYNDLITYDNYPFKNTALTNSSFIAAPFPTVYSLVEQERCIEVQVPQYTYTHSRNNADCMVGPTASYGYVVNSNRISSPTVLSTYPVKEDGWDIDIYPVVLRAGADDVNFGGFVSIPPLIYTLS